jgi:LysM repeat protein
MGNKLTLFAAVVVFGCSSNTLLAQKMDRRSKLLADNISISKQALKLDSIIASHLSQEDNYIEDDSDNPASELYEGAWSSKGVNANRVMLDKVPDSVTFDCSGYSHPIMGTITSLFGPRPNRYHYGVDIKLNIGDQVASAWDGKVRVTNYDKGGYGSYIVIRHNNGLETVYGHLSQIKVFEGQAVRAGQIIALGGNSGHSTGPHLHFETRFLGNPINPERFIDFENGITWNDKYLMKKDVAFEYIKYTKNPGRYYTHSVKSNENENLSASISKNNRHDHKKNKKEKEKLRLHKVRDGETLSHIAEKHNIPINTLCRLNGISKKSTLRPGQKIKYS